MQMIAVAEIRVLNPRARNEAKAVEAYVALGHTEVPAIVVNVSAATSGAGGHQSS